MDVAAEEACITQIDAEWYLYSSLSLDGDDKCQVI